ncbi:hypothetical protein RHMOL_Rhmol08G0156300 [Rhododendron molle]|uniref:Uncharacterized protein n=1 Tax=Rhododendron molle TaxID=49168 RepID=A0ACC0MP50_RHOML|nr:hypothetical protein RHMOL_Rhmol08G0156300 [Rhododendron molle]
MLAMGLIRQSLYRVENEPKYKVHSHSCLTRMSDPFKSTPINIAKFFNESEGSESQLQENKTPTPDSSKESLEKHSK